MIKEFVHGLRVLYSQFIGSQNAKFAYKHPSAKVNPPCIICGAENISLEENVSIGPDSIMFAPLTDKVKQKSASSRTLTHGMKRLKKSETFHGSTRIARLCVPLAVL